MLRHRLGLNKLVLVGAMLLLPEIASAAGVQLSWKDNSDNETGFELERAPDKNSAFARITLIGANVQTYLDGVGVAGNCYRLRAYNTNGFSMYSNTACALFGPTGLQAVVQ
jgi:hypothetical protein